MDGSEQTVFWHLSRWQLVWIIGIAAYVGIAFVEFEIAFRYLCVGAIVVGLAASGRANSRRFLHDWFPLLVFWIGYDAMRGFADEIARRVAVQEPFEWERALFGWLPGGQVAPLYFLNLLEGSRWKIPVNAVADVFYWSHFVVIPGYMLTLWWRPPTPLRFKKFVVGLTLLHLFTLATYFLYPAAPPWYVFQFGFHPPTAELLNPYELNPPAFFQQLWAANPNWFAAIPSLHGAYPVFLFCLVEPTARARRRVAIYGVAVWLATIVRGHHYIIDLLLGALYAVPCAWIADRYVRETRDSNQVAAETLAKEHVLR
jgi:hypothetical protein